MKTRGSHQARSWRRERRRASGPTPLVLTSRSITVGPGDCVYPSGLNRYGQPHEILSHGTAVLRGSEEAPLMLTAAHRASASAAHTARGAVQGSSAPSSRWVGWRLRLLRFLS